MSKSKIQQKTNVMPPFQLYSHGNSLTKTINNGAQRKKRSNARQGRLATLAGGSIIVPQPPTSGNPAGGSSAGKNIQQGFKTGTQQIQNRKFDNTKKLSLKPKKFYGGKTRRKYRKRRTKKRKIRGGSPPCQGSTVEFDDLQVGEKYCFDPIIGHGETGIGLYGNIVKPLKGVVGTLLSKIKSSNPNTNIIWMELPVGNKWGEQYKRAKTVYKYAPDKGDWYDYEKYDIEPEITDSEYDEIVDFKGGKVDKRLRKNIKTKSRKTRRKYYKKKPKKRKRKKTKKRKHRF